MQSLRVEFEVNRDQAAAVVLVHEMSLQSTVRLLSLTEDEILALSGDDVDRYIGYFTNPRTFDAVRGSVDALTSSGKLGVLQTRELREALTTFVSILEDAVEERHYMSQWSMIVWSEVARNGGPYRKRAGSRTTEECVNLPLDSGCYISNSIAYLPAATPQDLLRLRNHTTLMGYINQSQESSVRYAQSQIATILTLLEQSL